MKDDYITGVLSSFEENRPKTDDRLLIAKDQTSDTYHFGYKYQVGNTIHEVTDWGNIKSFIAEALQGYGQWQRQALAEEVRNLHSETQCGDGFVGASDAEWAAIKRFLPLYTEQLAAIITNPSPDEKAN